jgi:hypothetical protein
MRLKMAALSLIVVTAQATSLAAQSLPDSTPGAISGPPVTAALPPKAGMIGMRIDNNMDATPLKGAPFCATIATEHTQVFADGNRIHTTDNSTLCRDSEGRTRREASLNLLGVAPQKSGTKLITIVDPVAGLRYLLDSDNKIARRMVILSSAGPTLKSATGPGQAGLPAKGARMMFYEGASIAGPDVFFNNGFTMRTGQGLDEPAPTTENLGDETIDGIPAIGTRITTTIPSGKMGNEQPIVVTSERWYSPELKATVMTKHNDPWAGELKTQFTRVNTSEPEPSLFTVPGDYKIVDEKDGPFTIQLPSPAPTAQ